MNERSSGQNRAVRLTPLLLHRNFTLAEGKLVLVYADSAVARREINQRSLGPLGTPKVLAQAIKRYEPFFAAAVMPQNDSTRRGFTFNRPPLRRPKQCTGPEVVTVSNQ
jgi:hypothetical protein